MLVPPKPAGAIRVLHLSDVHVDVPLGQLPTGGWLGKRLLGGANLVLRRGKHFRGVRGKLQSLDEFRRRSEVDLVVCTGDYTALGSDLELAAAREAIEPLTGAPLGYVTVPGNHDVYVPDAVGAFERYFGDLLESDLPEHRVEGRWPLVRLVGDTVAVIAVDSARPNPQPWRSSGRIPDPQIEALRRIVRDPRLEGRFVFVITHYACRLANGQRDRFTHGLINADQLLSACAQLPRGALLHGHVHRCYSVRVPGVRPTLFCAGSTTQDRREGLWLFDVGADAATARQGTWGGEGYVLTGETVEL